MDVSQLEQELACNDDHSSRRESLMEKSVAQNSKQLQIALALLTRCAGDTADISSLKRELLDAGVSQQKVQLIDAIRGTVARFVYENIFGGTLVVPQLTGRFS